MNTIQKVAVAAVILGLTAIGLHQASQASKLRKEVHALRQQQQQDQAAFAEQLQAAERQRDRARNQLDSLSHDLATTNKNPAEVQKLRGEVGRLRRENADIASTSPLSKVTAKPEMVKLLREQQKLGMSLLYKGFAANTKLTPEQTQKLNELLADHIMDNVGHVTTALRDKPGPEQLNQLFANQEAALDEQVRQLLGDDGLAKYQDYTHRLLSTLSADQFKGMLTGENAAKEEKAKHLSKAIQESVDEALASSGLPANYQPVPILNFRNIASEQEADKALKLLDTIYQGAATRGSAFLSPEDLTKFQEFRGIALTNSRAALGLNRSMMAPIAD